VTTQRKWQTLTGVPVEDVVDFVPWRREVRPRIASLRERLLREVWLSVEPGLSLSPVVPGH
jgi:hypothetical protein